jgi:transposase InsO family protein
VRRPWCTSRWAGARPSGRRERRAARRERAQRHVSVPRSSVSVEWNALAEIGARHKRTRPFRPQTNGKAERFNGTFLTEWAYARLYVTNQARLDAFPAWLDFYNRERPHGSLGGQSPMTVLVNNVSGNHI